MILEKIDHDLLARIDEKLKELKIQFNNHLKHHYYLEAGIVLALLGSVLSRLWGYLI